MGRRTVVDRDSLERARPLARPREAHVDLARGQDAEQTIDPALRITRDRDADAGASPPAERVDQRLHVLGVAERASVIELLLEDAEVIDLDAQHAQNMRAGRIAGVDFQCPELDAARGSQRAPISSAVTKCAAGG